MKKLPPQLVGLALAALALMPAAGNAADKKLEVFSWWTSGGEAAALDALFKDYKATNPGVEIVNAAVAAGYCEPVTDIYTSEGWDKVVPKGLIEILSKEGKAYSVLCGVHRGNVLWYNKKLLEKNGVKVGDKMTFDEFFAAADKLKAAGGTPLAGGDKGNFSTPQPFQNTLLCVVGPPRSKEPFTVKMSFTVPN